VARRVADSLTGHQGYGLVLEVGPGTGALSRHLVDRPGFRWMGIEVDRESIAYLHRHFPDWAPRVVEADFLRLDVGAWIGKEPFAVAGNFPYHISSQILFKVLQHRQQVPEVVGMFQKEVAERIASGPGNKTYGILSVLMQAYYRVELLFTVSHTVFEPPPKVQSAVLRLRRKEDISLGCDEDLFVRVVKTAFNQRRKTLRNALKIMQPDWDALPEGMGSLRAEALGVPGFVTLTRQVPPRT